MATTLAVRPITALTGNQETGQDARAYTRGMLTVPATLFDGMTLANTQGALRNVLAQLTDGSNSLAVDAANLVNKSGIGYELHKTQRVREAIANPAQYLQARENAMVYVAEQMEAKYFKTVKELFAAGLSREDAGRIAEAGAKAEAEAEIAKINLNYPTDIVNSVLATTQNQAAAGRATAGLLAVAP